jgi:hypothetical protein
MFLKDIFKPTKAKISLFILIALLAFFLGKGGCCVCCQKTVCESSCCPCFNPVLWPLNPLDKGDPLGFEGIMIFSALYWYLISCLLLAFIPRQ